MKTSQSDRDFDWYPCHTKLICDKEMLKSHTWEIYFCDEEYCGRRCWKVVKDCRVDRCNIDTIWTNFFIVILMNLVSGGTHWCLWLYLWILTISTCWAYLCERWITFGWNILLLLEFDDHLQNSHAASDIVIAHLAYFSQ